MTATVSLRDAPDCACPACRRYVDTLADLEAATRERHHARRSRRAYDVAEPYPTGPLARELRRSAARMDRAHAGGSITETPRPSIGPQAEAGLLLVGSANPGPDATGCDRSLPKARRNGTATADGEGTAATNGRKGQTP